MKIHKESSKKEISPPFSVLQKSLIPEGAEIKTWWPMGSFQPAWDASSHLQTLQVPCKFRRENAALLNRECAHNMQSQKNERHRWPYSLPKTNSCQQNPRKLSRTNSCLSSKTLQTQVFPKDKSLTEERCSGIRLNAPLDGGAVWEDVQCSGEAPGVRSQV